MTDDDAKTQDDKTPAAGEKDGGTGTAETPDTEPTAPSGRAGGPAPVEDGGIDCSDDSEDNCDPDKVDQVIQQQIEEAKLEAVVADREKLREAIKKADESYREKHEDLVAKQQSLAEFKKEALGVMTDTGAFSKKDKKKIEKIVADAVQDIAHLQAKRRRLKGFMPSKVGEQEKFKFGEVGEALLALEDAKKEHEVATANLKTLTNLAAAIAARHATLEKMKGDITKRITGPKELATFSTAWWLIKQKDQGGVLLAKGFYKGLMKGDPKVIDADCLAQRIYCAWEAEAAAKAKVYLATKTLQDKEDSLKEVEKDIADAEGNLIKKITKEIEAWDCIRMSFPEHAKEPENA